MAKKATSKFVPPEKGVAPKAEDKKVPAEKTPPVAAGPEAQPKFRMNNPRTALGLIKQSAKRVQFQVKQDRLVGDAYDRMPPIDPAILAKSAESWRTNVDYGDTENAVNEKVEALNNLISLPMPFIDFKMNRQNVEPTTIDALSVVGLEHHALLTESDIWTMECQKMAFNMVAFGLGIFHFPDPHSWHFESVPRVNLIYPAKSGMNPSKWPWLALRTEIQITDLIAKLGNSEAAATMGWDVAKVKKLIKGLKTEQTFPSGRGLPSLENDPEAYVNALVDNDLSIACENGEVVPAFKLYVKEFDGEITEHILADSEEIGFLYHGNHRFKSFSDFLTLFPLSLGQGFLEKIRGLGHRVLPFNALINDLKNRSVDLTILSGGLMLKGTKEDGLMDVSQLLMGGLVTLIPEEYTLEQRSFGNPSQGLIAVEQNLTMHREANKRVFGGSSGAEQPDMTATHAKLKYNENTRGNGFETDRFYQQLTLFHRALWDRLTYFNEKGEAAVPCEGAEEAKAFWKRLKDAGVTNDDIKAIRTIVAATLFGDGDPNQVFMALADLAPYMPSLPVTAQRDALRMLIAARTRKPHLAEAWLPTQTKGDRERSAQNWRTATEEDAFENGSPMPHQDDDINSIHAVNHTAWAEGVLQNFEQGVMQPADALKRLILVRDHTMVHLQMLSRSKLDEPTSRELGTKWKNILNMMRRLEYMVREQQAAERERMLQELRNPSLTPEQRQQALTEQFKREQTARTEELRRQEISLTEATKRDLMTKGALTDAQIKAIASAPLLEERTEPNDA